MSGGFPDFIYGFNADGDSFSRAIVDAGLQAVTVRQTTAEKGYPLVHVMSEEDDGSTFNAIGDYSGGGATTWEYRPGAGVKAHLTRILPLIGDAGAFDAEDYGNGVALTNGITIDVVTDVLGTPTVLYTLVDSDNPILANIDWKRVSYDTELSTWGTGDEFLTARWTWDKFSAGVELDGDNGDALRIHLNDDFSGLTQHKFTVEGRFGANLW